MITALYTAVLGFWLVFLLLRVVRARFKYQVGLGAGNEPQLEKAIRIHGNFTETVPYILIIMLLLEMQTASVYLIHGFGVMLIISRLLHWYGISGSVAKSYGRTIGTVIAVALILLGSALLILHNL